MRTPIVMDVEASGFGRGSYPIEVGLALADGSARCFLVRPERDWAHWDIDAQRIHRLTPEILRTHGLPCRVVAEQLNALLVGTTVYSDSWGNDQSWLARLFEAAQQVQRFRLESLRALLSESQLSYWLDARAESLREMGQTRHRASVDAAIVQRSFIRTVAAAQRASALTGSD